MNKTNKFSIIKSIRGLLSYILSNFRVLSIAFLWILFLLFFTYTPLFLELAKRQGNFISLFYQEQSQYITLIVNMGIVLMFLFDNTYNHKRLEGVVYYIPIIAVVLSVFIQVHCSLNIDNNLSQLKKPLSIDYLSMILYGFFCVLMFILKVNSLSNITQQIKGIE